MVDSPSNTNIDDDTGVPDYAAEAIYLGLALRIAPGFGKVVSPDTKMFADAAYSNLVNQTATPTPERTLPTTMPRGQGTKTWRNFNNPFVRQEDPAVDAGNDGHITLE